jgi:hypothetical protein
MIPAYFEEKAGKLESQKAGNPAFWLVFLEAPIEWERSDVSRPGDEVGVSEATCLIWMPCCPLSQHSL